MNGHEEEKAFSHTDEWPQDATEWLMLLREEPDDAEIRSHFEAWCKASPANQRDWELMSHTMGVLRRVPSNDDISVPADRQFRLARALWRNRPIRMGGGIAALAATVVFGMWLGPDVALRFQADTITGRQELRTVALADGSNVVLAPQSAIASRFTGGRREVRLLKGEALFKVRHDNARPFTVFARGVTVTDIGTVFDVDTADRERVTVAVKEGRVSVNGLASRPSPVLLEAGEAVTQRSGITDTDTLLPAEIGAWAQGQLVVHNKSMHEVAALLSHYTRGPIIVHGATLADEHVTGIYTLSNPDEALQALANGQNARVFHVTPWLTVLSR